MPTRKPVRGELMVEGRVQFEELPALPSDLKVMAYI